VVSFAPDPSARSYIAYGAPVLSAIALPELVADGVCPLQRVAIRAGAVPSTLDAARKGAFYEVSHHSGERRFLLRVDQVARYLAANGNEILVDAAPGADEDSVRLFLLGSVFGALLYQRGLLPLHASAIETSRGAVILAGGSGVGKSALAAALYARGYRVIADEICAIDCNTAGSRVFPAFPRLLLWPDVIEQLALWTADVRPARPKIKKYHVPVGKGFEKGFASDPLPVYALYVLQVSRTGASGFSGVAGAEKVRELVNLTFRRPFASGMISGTAYFDQVTRIARDVPISRFARPFSLSVRESADLLERDFTR
jgi:hypothetical protein